MKAFYICTHQSGRSAMRSTCINLSHVDVIRMERIDEDNSTMVTFYIGAGEIRVAVSDDEARMLYRKVSEFGA